MYPDHEGNRIGDISPRGVREAHLHYRGAARAKALGMVPYNLRFHAFQNHEDHGRRKTTRAPLMYLSSLQNLISLYVFLCTGSGNTGTHLPLPPIPALLLTSFCIDTFIESTRENHHHNVGTYFLSFLLIYIEETCEKRIIKPKMFYGKEISINRALLQ